MNVIVDTFAEAPVTKVDAYFTTAAGAVDQAHLREIGSNGQAHRVLAAGMYLATCEVDLEGAIDFARQTADPDGVAAVAGALIGASTGVTPWTCSSPSMNTPGRLRSWCGICSWWR